MLDAAERLRHRLDIVFLIIGEGNQTDYKRLIVPSKFYRSIAAGRAVIFIGA